MQYLLAFLVGAALVAPAGASARPVQTETEARAERALRATLGRHMAAAGRSSGAYVVNTTEGRVVYRLRAGQARILASNTKLFTTATALARFGTDGTLGTEVLGEGAARGGRRLGGRSLPARRGRPHLRQPLVHPPELRWRARDRGGAGPPARRGRAQAGDGPHRGRRVALRLACAAPPTPASPPPPRSAARCRRWRSTAAWRASAASPSRPTRRPSRPARLDAALEDARHHGAPQGRGGQDARGRRRFWRAWTRPRWRGSRALTNKPSDNLFAELLLKAIGWQAAGRGTTANGAAAVRGFAARLGAPARIVDGSGLSRGDRATPRRGGQAAARHAGARRVRGLLRLPRRRRARRHARAIEWRAARRGGNCRGKTGTLSNVSALSGYCEARSGEVYAFSILMNGVYPTGARALQDRMAQAIAGYAGIAVSRQRQRSAAARPSSSRISVPSSSAFVILLPGSSPATT